MSLEFAWSLMLLPAIELQATFRGHGSFRMRTIALTATMNRFLSVDSS